MSHLLNTLFENLNYITHPLSIHFIVVFILLSATLYYLKVARDDEQIESNLWNYIFPKDLYSYQNIKTDLNLGILNLFLEGLIGKIFFSATTFAALALGILIKLFPDHAQNQPWTLVSLTLFTFFCFFGEN